MRLARDRDKSGVLEERLMLSSGRLKAKNDDDDDDET
jgi:hypothetical protein